MRRGFAALLVAWVTAALVPAATPAGAGGTDWVELLRRDVSTRVDVSGLAGVGTKSARERRVMPVEPDGEPDGVYGQDCAAPATSGLALRRAAVTVARVGARFTAEGCEDWAPADLAGGAVAWRLATPGGAGDADYTVAVAGRGLEVTVTAADGATKFTGQGELDGDDGVSVTVPPEAIGGHSEFGLVVVATDASGGRDALTGRDGRPLLFPSTPETAVAGAVTVTAAPGAFDDAVAAVEATAFAVTTPVPEIGAFGVEAVGPADVADLRALPGVSDVRPATAASVTAVPSAAHYEEQWALHGTHGIRAPSAWTRRTGSGRTVAVIDTGVDGTRSDLRGRVLAGWDTRTDTPLPARGNSDIHDPGHGTAVAGIIAADGGNYLAGLDWTARILPYRFSNAAGTGEALAVADGIVRATNAGADVVNLSLGTAKHEPALANAVRYATARGVVLIAAAGNSAHDGNPTMYPGAYPQVVAVGATTPSGTRAFYSNTGTHLHLVAPGGDGSMGGSDRNVLMLGRDPDLFAAAGTSFAAPHVAGAASLYLEGHPSASPAAVAAALAETAVDRGPAGKDIQYGHGLLDAGEVVTREPRVSAAIARACPPADVERPRFRDVFTNSHYEAIACLSWWDLTGGVTPRTYEPGDRVQRGQMATFLIRLLREAGVTVPPASDEGFTDVAGTIHAPAINQLAALGIASGRSATLFAPQARVTREQMATFIAKTHEVATGERLSAGPDMQFADISDSRHREWILALATAGVVSGTGRTTYNPRGEVTRAQMASFLMREASLLVKDGHAAPPIP